MARRKSSKIAAAADATKAKLSAVEGPSPNPMTNLILTDLLLRGGGQIMRHAVEASLLKAKYDKTKAKKIIAGRSLTQTLVATAVARIATRSVPGMHPNHTKTRRTIRRNAAAQQALRATTVRTSSRSISAGRSNRAFEPA